MSEWRRWFFRWWIRRWFRSVRIWPVLGLVICAGCGSYDSYLASLYNGARSDLEHGELPQAQFKSRRGSFLARGIRREEWEWKFRTIEAEIQVQRREPARALAALAGQLPVELEGTETALVVDFEKASASIWAHDGANARKLFDRAEECAKHAGNHNWLAAIESRRGTLAMLESRGNEAQAYFLESIRLAKETGQSEWELSSVASLGYLQMQSNHFGQAVDWFRSAIGLAIKLSEKTSLQRNLGNLGWCYYNLGELDSALESFKEAERLARELNIQIDQRRWLTNLGLVFSALENYRAAETYHLRALAIGRQIGDTETIAVCLHNLAYAEVDNRNLISAQQYNREETQLKQTLGNRAELLRARYTEGTIEDGLRHYQAAEEAFRQVADGHLVDPILRWQALCWLAGTHSEEGKGKEARQDYEDAVKTFDQTRQQQGSDEFKIAFRAGVNRYYSPYIRFLMNQGNHFDALSVAELSRAQVLAERLGVDAGSRLELPKIQATAGALHATILSYWLAPKASYLWVITAKDFTAITLPEGAEISRLAESYRQNIASSSRAPDTRLYETLIAPAQKYIAPGSRVVLIPDAALFQVNFETLQVPGTPQPHYWIEDVVLSTATSLSLLGADGPVSPRGNVLLIGNSLSPRPEFPALPYSRAEIHSIADRFPENKSAIYEEKDAVPSVYEKAHPENYSWIHFAAHGVASKESPLESAIILSDEGDSYKLYARDISKHKLTADLVTISACYGSGTRTYAGEGIVGLAWAFLLAGAHNVVASLWEASDYYTAQLMDRMYERLRAGDDPAHALRTAKLSLLHSQYVCRNPRYWGAFQLYTGY
jgi:CHAT domain-containing protein